jgi:hypothetical protein
VCDYETFQSIAAEVFISLEQIIGLKHQVDGYIKRPVWENENNSM